MLPLGTGRIIEAMLMEFAQYSVEQILKTTCKTYNEEEVLLLLTKALNNHYLRTNKGYLKILFEDNKKK